MIKKNKSIPQESLLLLGGLFGFCIGAFHLQTYQVAVEAAQVVSGIVSYPENIPFDIFQRATWTSIHQICALFLLAGVSEQALSIFISGIIGFISFQALTCGIYALSRDVVISIISPFIIFISDTTALDSAFSYQVQLLGTDATYGVFGLSFVVLSAMLVGMGYYRVGYLFIGIAPSIHPSCGALLWLIVIICIFWGKTDVLPAFRGAWRYFLAGACLTVISLIVHYVFIDRTPAADPETTATYYQYFIQNWGHHRRPINFDTPDIFVNFMVIIICPLLLIRCKKDLYPASQFILRFFTVAAALSLLFSIFSNIPLGVFPDQLIRVMPFRVININVLGYLILIFGIQSLYRGNLFHQIFMIITLALMFMSATNVIQTEEYIQRALFCVLGLMMIALPESDVFRIKFPKKYIIPTSKLIRAVAAVGVLFIIINLPHLRPTSEEEVLQDWRNTEILKKIHDGEGLLLVTAHLNFIQLRTRRPTMSAFMRWDDISYAPTLGPRIREIMEDIHGLYFFDPPKVEDFDLGKHDEAFWKKQTREEWIKIRKRYGVTQVLLYNELKLPLAATDQEDFWINLYDIPEK